MGCGSALDLFRLCSKRTQSRSVAFFQDFELFIGGLGGIYGVLLIECNHVFRWTPHLASSCRRDGKPACLFDFLCRVPLEQAQAPTLRRVILSTRGVTIILISAQLDSISASFAPGRFADQRVAAKQVLYAWPCSTAGWRFAGLGFETTEVWST